MLRHWAKWNGAVEMRHETQHIIGGQNPTHGEYICGDGDVMECYHEGGKTTSRAKKETTYTNAGGGAKKFFWTSFQPMRPWGFEFSL
jgi:hypothetical protein